MLLREDSPHLLRIKTPQVWRNDHPVGENVINHGSGSHGAGEAHIAHGDCGRTQGKDVRALGRSCVTVEINQNADAAVPRRGKDHTGTE